MKPTCTTALDPTAQDTGVQTVAAVVREYDVTTEVYDVGGDLLLQVRQVSYEPRLQEHFDPLQTQLNYRQSPN